MELSEATLRLLSAIGSRDLEAVKAAISEGADVNAVVDSGNVRIPHVVGELGDGHIMHELMQHNKFDAFVKDDAGQTSLHYAAATGNIGVFYGAQDALVEQNKDSEFLEHLNTRNYNMKTPYQVAYDYKDNDTMEALKGIGADPTLAVKPVRQPGKGREIDNLDPVDRQIIEFRRIENISDPSLRDKPEVINNDSPEDRALRDGNKQELNDPALANIPGNLNRVDELAAISKRLQIQGTQVHNTNNSAFNGASTGSETVSLTKPQDKSPDAPSLV